MTLSRWTNNERNEGSRLWLPLLAVVSFVALVAAGRGVRAGYRRIAHVFKRWMGARAARALGWVVAAVLTVGLVSGVIVDGVLALACEATGQVLVEGQSASIELNSVNSTLGVALESNIQSQL